MAVREGGRRHQHLSVPDALEDVDQFGERSVLRDERRRAGLRGLGHPLRVVVRGDDAMMVSGEASLMFFAATSPSWRGIWMSITTMSGRSSMALATPVAALVAIPTHGHPRDVLQRGCEQFGERAMVIDDDDGGLRDRRSMTRRRQPGLT